MKYRKLNIYNTNIFPKTYYIDHLNDEVQEVRNVNLQLQKCASCGKTFTSICNLKRHEKDSYKGDSPVDAAPTKT